MGLFSANGALAGFSGALIGGVLVRYFGYVAPPLAAATVICVGVILSRGLTESTAGAGSSQNEMT